MFDKARRKRTRSKEQRTPLDFGDLRRVDSSAQREVAGVREQIAPVVSAAGEKLGDLYASRSLSQRRRRLRRSSGAAQGGDTGGPKPEKARRRSAACGSRPRLSPFAMAIAVPTTSPPLRDPFSAAYPPGPDTLGEQLRVSFSSRGASRCSARISSPMP
jgi:hypothetical protein